MKLTHQLRALHHSILAGVETIIADNPSLTVRYGIEGSNPLPIILDSNLRIPLHCKLLTSSECRRPVIVTLEETFLNPEKISICKTLQQSGASILVCKKSENNRIDLNDMIGKEPKLFLKCLQA